MNRQESTFAQFEATLECLYGRFPDLPEAGVFCSRLVLYPGRGSSALLNVELRPFDI